MPKFSKDKTKRNLASLTGTVSYAIIPPFRLVIVKHQHAQILFGRDV